LATLHRLAASMGLGAPTLTIVMLQNFSNRHVRMAHAVEICWVNNNFPANMSCSNSFSKGLIWTDYVSCLELGGTACLSVLPPINYQSSFWMVGSGPRMALWVPKYFRILGPSHTSSTVFTVCHSVSV
jgi:hypothetical protein